MVTARARRKVRTGSVVRVKQDKTAVVEMVWKQRHRLYHKQVRRVARFYVHDPENQCQLGDVVRIEETRPISKTKHWRLLEILERRQVAEVRPIELEGDAATAVAEPEIEDTLLELDEDIDPDILDQLTAVNGEFEDEEDD
ncbi:MAG: 30S ribosomal protein S17 [Chloroflexi bacterium]|nr:30S ribosomal protein S17 [Chloroflexota bacterium]MYE42216.1 30S ribosomal protein S17 [Chloroflexota bacterium]